jgi:hypothetical protein
MKYEAKTAEITTAMQRLLAFIPGLNRKQIIVYFQQNTAIYFT